MKMVLTRRRRYFIRLWVSAFYSSMDFNLTDDFSVGFCDFDGLMLSFFLGKILLYGMFCLKIEFLRTRFFGMFPYLLPLPRWIFSSMFENSFDSQLLISERLSKLVYLFIWGWCAFICSEKGFWLGVLSLSSLPPLILESLFSFMKF